MGGEVVETPMRAEESVGFRACWAIFDDFRLIQGGESGVWLGQMSISPTQKQVKRAKIEPKHLNPTDSVREE